MPSPELSPPELLSIDRLGVTYHSDLGDQVAVENFSLQLRAGEIVALVGESGSGKTSIALAIPRLLPAAATISGKILFDGEELTALPESRLRAIRGRRIGFVFQDSLAALDPVVPVGRQLEQAVAAGSPGESRRERRARARQALVAWGLSDPDFYLGAYAHQLNGGARQRVALATALAAGPQLLVADEPTSALDAIARYDAGERLRELCESRGLAVLLVTHDLALASHLADRRIGVRGGQRVPAESLFAQAGELGEIR